MTNYRKFIAFQRALEELERGNVRNALRLYRLSGMSNKKVPLDFH